MQSVQLHAAVSDGGSCSNFGHLRMKLDMRLMQKLNDLPHWRSASVSQQPPVSVFAWGEATWVRTGRNIQGLACVCWDHWDPPHTLLVKYSFTFVKSGLII